MTVTKVILQKKIETAKYILKQDTRIRFTDNRHKSYLAPNCYSFYSSTNENLNYYYKLPSMEGKDVLVPTASGDHALNALYLGAKSVETFDINSLAFFNHELKEAAVKTLSRDEFLNFFSTEKFYDRNIYEKIRPALRKPTREFFDAIYTFIDSNENKDSVFFREGDNVTKLYNLIEEAGTQIRENIVKNNPYLKTKKSYDTLKQKLLKMEKPIKHKLCSAHELNLHFDSKDVIIYSNILRYYFYEEYEDRSYHLYSDTEKQFKTSLSKVLKKDGYASLLYVYNVRKGDSLYSQELALDDLQLKTSKILVSSSTNMEKYDRISLLKKSENPKLSNEIVEL